MAAATGGAGSVLITLGGLLGRSGLTWAYAGLALLVAGWWWHGRAGAASGRHFWASLGLWAAPLLVAPPLFSRDVYSYLAQGLMVQAGLDVHRVGPAALGGPVAALVPDLWRDTPSPYGPVSLLASRVVVAVTGTDAAAGVLGMRLVALAALVLLAAVLPILAGPATARARWLVALNPLVLIHLIGGAHNDALMVALLAAGLAAAVRHRPVAAAALVTLAALVKIPAVLGLAAVVVICAARGHPVRALVTTGAAAAATTVLVTAVAGTGYGWIAALDAPVSPGNWAPASVLGRWTAATFTRDQVGAALAVDLWRWAGVFATLVVAGLVWAYRHRLGALAGLGIVLVAVVAFGPALRPWYVIWGLVPLAAAVPAAHRALALLSAGLTPVVLPDGYAADAAEVLAAVLGLILGVAVFALVSAPVPARRVLR